MTRINKTRIDDNTNTVIAKITYEFSKDWSLYRSENDYSLYDAEITFFKNGKYLCRYPIRKTVKSWTDSKVITILSSPSFARDYYGDSQDKVIQEFISSRLK